MPIGRIPALGQPGAPFFVSKNITEFLRAYDTLTEDYMVSLEVKWSRFLQYVDLSVRGQIRGITEYSAEDFSRYNEGNFYEALKEDFAQ